MKFVQTVLLVMVLASAAGFACAEPPPPILPRPDWYVPPPPPTFADFLTSGFDLVVIGTIESATETRRGYSRIRELMILPVTEVRLRIDQVIFGSAPDSVIEMTLDEIYGLKAGDRIVTWGFYTWEDDWRLRGRCLRIDGNLLRSCGGSIAPAFTGASGPQQTVPWREVEIAIHGRHPSTIFNGARSIALAKLRGSSRWSKTGAVYEIDSLGWVIGSGQSLPRVIRFPAVPGCSVGHGIFPGDSLLVPLPPASRGNELLLVHCPSALGVKHGFVPGLGVPLSEVRRSIDTDGPVLRVRPFQRKEN